MVTKDINAGLLSKMAKFVLNPTTSWSELDKPDPPPDTGYSKLALKEMIERKRQNDFVRRREFDYLRKLRRNGLASTTDRAGRPSFFQSSTTSNLDERATTIKKIDEIEAHMSKQWWRGKQGEDASPVVNMLAAADLNQADSDAKTLHYETTHSSALETGAELGEGAEYESTQMGLAMPEDASFGEGAQQGQITTSTGSRRDEPGASGFVVSKLFSIELGNDLADPDMEEAAIRFANSDDVGAEAGLLTALQSDVVNADLADGWAAALFDLYRATGQQASFDRVAIDYAQRFGRSAPAWFSTPDLLGHKPITAHPSPTLTPENVEKDVWDCPPLLDSQAMDVLSDYVYRTPMPWLLNWCHVKAISPQAAKALAELFARWCSTPVKLHFFGAEVLEKILRSMTLSGDKRIESFLWQLRLDALRILRLQDEFELAALDFCVTYEVSPPPWKDAKCVLVQDRVSALITPGASGDLLADVDYGGLASADQVSSELIGLHPLAASLVELSGEVLGDAVDVLDKLQGKMMVSDRLVISCARLIRVDFSAAGSILNWVAMRESEGCHVQFRDVPRLVAAFFNVIGINEHARVVLRNS